MDARHVGRAQAATPPGLVTLTVPAGGGKTLASLAHALDRAAIHSHRRIIHAIPCERLPDKALSAIRLKKSASASSSGPMARSPNGPPGRRGHAAWVRRRCTGGAGCNTAFPSPCRGGLRGFPSRCCQCPVWGRWIVAALLSRGCRDVAGRIQMEIEGMARGLVTGLRIGAAARGPARA